MDSSSLELERFSLPSRSDRTDTFLYQLGALACLQPVHRKLSFDISTYEREVEAPSKMRSRTAVSSANRIGL